MTNATPLKLALLGDITMSQEFTRVVGGDRNPTLSCFSPVMDSLRSSDLTLINLEGPILKIDEEGEPRSDVTIRLRNEEVAIDFCQLLPGCVINLANNHIMDFGGSGLASTLCRLDRSKVPCFGAGTQHTDAIKPVLVESKGKKIAFFGATTDDMSVRSVLAGEATPGCGSLSDTRLLNAISAARQSADFVCVSLHWGREFYEYPAPAQVDFAHTIVDAGATLVVGHHSHVFEPVEQYGNGLIFYGIGNFLAPPIRQVDGRLRAQKTVEKEFTVIQVELDGSQISYSLRTGKRNDAFAFSVNEPGSEMAAKRSNEFKTALESGDYNAFWNSYRSRRIRALEREKLRELIQRMFTTPSEALAHCTFTDLWRTLKRARRAIAG